MSNQNFFTVNQISPAPSLRGSYNLHASTFPLSLYPGALWKFVATIDGQIASISVFPSNKSIPISYSPSQDTFQIVFYNNSAQNTAQIVTFNTVNVLPPISPYPAIQASIIKNVAQLAHSALSDITPSNIGNVFDGYTEASQLGFLFQDIGQFITTCTVADNITADKLSNYPTSVSYTQVFANILAEEFNANLGSNTNSRFYFSKGPIYQDAYMQALAVAVNYLQQCALIESGLGNNQNPDQGSQTGRFVISLQSNIFTLWQKANPGNTAQNALTEATKKSAALTQANIAATKAASQQAAKVQISDNYTTLINNNALAQASIQIMSGVSTGANTFTNPGGSPNSIYSILDIMRNEYTTPAKKNTTVNVTTIQNQIAQGTFNNSVVQAQIIAKLSPVQKNSLITVANNTMDSNVSLMGKLIVSINKLQNSAAFDVAACWSRLIPANISTWNWHGTYYDQKELTIFLNNVQQSASNLTQTNKNTTLALLNSANSIGLILNSSPSTLPSLGNSFLSGNYQQVINILAQNTAAIKKVQPSLSVNELSACSNIAQIVKAGVSSKQIISAANAIQTLSTQTIQNLLNKGIKLNNLNNQQLTLQNTIASLQAGL